MEMNIQTRKELTLRLVDDHEEGVYEVDAFLSSLIKIKKMVNKVGFLNKFSKQEKEVWNDFFERYNIVQEEPKGAGPNIQNVNNLQYIPGEDEL